MPTQTSTIFDGLIAYQIYPRSFKDTDGNGIGDLAGVTEKLDYLQWLGINTIWLSPFYTSPMTDFGYDVADYSDVDPVFGSLHDFEHLLTQAHKRGIKVIIDFVLNHTSMQHPWFQDSRSGPTSLKRDWYTWRPAKPNGSPPNNWLSVFGGSAWEYDSETTQYYLHSFLSSQPDLNWRNPEVRDEMKKIMRFWFDKGVDGLRLDAVNWLAKDVQLRDDPKNSHYKAKTDDPYTSLLHLRSARQKELYKYLNELVDVAKGYPGRMLIVEAVPEDSRNIDSYLAFYEHIDPSVLVPFNFAAISLPWRAADYKEYFDKFESELKSSHVPVYTFGNHDSSRVASRIGDVEARAAAVLLLALPGMPFIYYGEELGLKNLPEGRKQQDRARRYPHRHMGRDPERAPMPWNNHAKAGFTRMIPWLPINRNHKKINVKTEAHDPSSTLSLYRHMLELRKNSTILSNGRYVPVKQSNRNLYMFGRELAGEKLLVVINYSEKPQHFHQAGVTVISSLFAKPVAGKLRPYEARITTLR